MSKSLVKSVSKKPIRKKARRVPYVKRIPGVEHKFMDTPGLDLIPAKSALMQNGLINPTAIRLINTVAVGDGPQNRDGKTIVIDTIVLEGVVQWAAHTLPTYPAKFPLMFMALVLDTQTNATAFDTAVGFVNPTGDDDGCVYPLKNLFNATRFQTLKVWNFSRKVQNSTPYNSGEGTDFYLTGDAEKFSCYLKVNIKTGFNSVTPTVQTVASITDNSLHMVAWQNTDDQALRCTVSYNARIRFVG